MTENARILLHPADSLLVPIDPSDVYYMEAVGGETLIRMRRSRPLKDVRPLGTLFPLFRRHGFLRVHRNHAVNLARIRQIRRRKGSFDWELNLQPPVNRILPISRNALAKLKAAFR